MAKKKLNVCPACRERPQYCMLGDKIYCAICYHYKFVEAMKRGDKLSMYVFTRPHVSQVTEALIGARKGRYAAETAVRNRLIRARCDFERRSGRLQSPTDVDVPKAYFVTNAIESIEFEVHGTFSDHNIAGEKGRFDFNFYDPDGRKWWGVLVAGKYSYNDGAYCKRFKVDADPDLVRKWPKRLKEIRDRDWFIEYAKRL